jgi:hypothetical protein
VSVDRRQPVPITLGVAATITIEIGAACNVKVHRGGTEVTAFNKEFSRDRLGNLRREIKDCLATFSNSFTTSIMADEPRFEIRDCMIALRKLQNFGYFLLLELLGEEHVQKLPRMTNLLRSACGHKTDPEWSPEPRWALQPPPPRLIKFVTSVGDGIPIDIIPFLDPYPNLNSVSDKLTDLGRLACSFLGFSAIVKRVTDDNKCIGICRHLENIPRLPIKMFINRSLKGSRKEERNFTDSKHHIDIAPGWPTKPTPTRAAFPGLLAKHLWEIDTRFGEAREVPDEICHFSCHSDTEANLLPRNYQIRLQSQRLGGRRKVTLEDLKTGLSALAENNAKDDRPRPLVFMNSCGSGDLDPHGASSFSQLFLSRTLMFTGFIGTETTIDDTFAAEFSRVFYHHLLRGQAIGSAILTSRWQLLREYRNPLGLMYTLFAEPEIKVRRPVKDSRVPEQGAIARFLSGLRRGVGF